MTHKERLAAQEADLRQKLLDIEAARQRDLADQRKALAKVLSQQREDERKARDARRYAVGKAADQAGLFVWDNTTLDGLFQALALLRDVPDPVAVLEGLLTDVEVAAGPSLLASFQSDSSGVSKEGKGEFSPSGNGALANLAR